VTTPLHTLLAGDAEKVFLNEDELAETIVYRESGFAPREVAALVSRVPPIELGEIGAGRAEVDVWVQNDAEKGVDKPDPRRDTIELPYELEGIGRELRVLRVITGDAGLWQLRCVGLGRQT